MILTEENGKALYEQYKEQFKESIEKMLKIEGCYPSLESYVNTVGWPEYYIFLDWYNSTIDKVEEKYYDETVKEFERSLGVEN